MRQIKIKSAIPVYAFALVWLIMGLSGVRLYEITWILVTLGISLLAYGLFSLAIPKKKVMIEEPKPEPERSGDTAADAVLDEGRAAIKKLQYYATGIRDHGVRAQAALLEGLLDDILDYILKHPGKASGIRRFANYYLPTTLKLFSNFEHLEKQDSEGENIAATRSSIQAALSNIVKAYRNQLDSLFADTRLDITTDIEVLEGMMRSDGLLDDNNKL